jgi:ATP-binding cassette, subfamily B, multidrug efflux pump
LNREGEIKETGTHNQLLKKGGYYEKLYQMQFQKKEVVA